jgi:4-hydroxy-tetrahydrodipicolinate reductase
MRAPFALLLRACLCLCTLRVARGFLHPPGAAAGGAHGRGAAAAAARAGESMPPSDVHVMMNGLPGNMGKEVAAACLRKGFKLAPYALTGPDIDDEFVMVDDMQGGQPVRVKLIKGNAEGVAQILRDAMQNCKQEGGILVSIDYTHPSAVNANADLYAEVGMPFVMGTTGGDREKLVKGTEASGVYAVIAPNMGKQIVALQTAIEYMSKEFPGSFEGYTLTVTESHQSTKADTSGTAKALAADMSTLTGAPYDVESINMIRDREGQLSFGVPEEHLGGHAFHTYSLKSQDRSVEFQFRHNVCGRRMYAEGTADAVAFLAQQVREGQAKRLYNMIDVLKAGGI